MSNTDLPWLPRYLRDVDSNSCYESAVMEKAADRKLLEALGYRPGDTPEKELERLLKGETYEEQRQNENLNRNAFKAEVDDLFRDTD